MLKLVHDCLDEVASHAGPIGQLMLSSTNSGLRFLKDKLKGLLSTEQLMLEVIRTWSVTLFDYYRDFPRLAHVWDELLVAHPNVLAEIGSYASVAFKLHIFPKINTLDFETIMEFAITGCSLPELVYYCRHYRSHFLSSYSMSLSLSHRWELTGNREEEKKILKELDLSRLSNISYEDAWKWNCRHGIELPEPAFIMRIKFYERNLECESFVDGLKTALRFGQYRIVEVATAKCSTLNRFDLDMLYGEAMRMTGRVSLCKALGRGSPIAVNVELSNLSTDLVDYLILNVPPAGRSWLSSSYSVCVEYLVWSNKQRRLAIRLLTANGWFFDKTMVQMLFGDYVASFYRSDYRSMPQLIRKIMLLFEPNAESSGRFTDTRSVGSFVTEIAIPEATGVLDCLRQALSLMAQAINKQECLMSRVVVDKMVQLVTVVGQVESLRGVLRGTVDLQNNDLPDPLRVALTNSILMLT